VGTDLPEPRKVTISLAVVAAELRGVIRRGLPVEMESAGEHLPHMRNVVARADHPDDFFSRIDAFNQLIAKLLGEMDDQELGQAARILFGLADGTQGTNLTARRRKCAEVLEYDYDHFRKRVEPRILRKVSEAFYRDLLRYRSRTKTWATAYETSRPTPSLTDADINPEEELVCRIWQHLYEIRAERIACQLAESEENAERHRVTADRIAKQLEALSVLYVDTYARQFIPNGTLDYTIEGLEKLVVWQAGTR
jgi:hypothetical protein